MVMVLFLMVSLKILVKIVWLFMDPECIRMMLLIQRRVLEVKLILLLIKLHKLVLYLLPLQVLILMKLDAKFNMTVRTPSWVVGKLTKDYNF